MARFLNMGQDRGDPFQASHTTPPLPPATPAPTVTAATPIPAVLSTDASIFLTFPANQAILTKVGTVKKGYRIPFKFEVYPKFTNCSFELLFKEEIVIQKQIKGSPSGAFELPVLIRRPGLYQWRIKTLGITSELRTVIIRDKKKLHLFISALQHSSYYHEETSYGDPLFFRGAAFVRGDGCRFFIFE